MTRILPVLLSLMILATPAFAQSTDGNTKIPAKPMIGANNADKSLQELSNTRPSEKFSSKKTDNVTVAMLFNKITNQQPDLTRWAQTSKLYQNTPATQKAAVLQTTIDKLRTKFSLMGPNEPIYIEQYITLRQYRPDAQGVFIDEFTPQTYYTYGFDNEYFAVIPSDLMDYEFLKISPDEMKDIGQHITNKNRLFMRLSLVPIKGDSSETVRLSNGFQNWLLAAKVMDIELWSPKDQTLLWRSNEAFYNRKNQLLNLYQ